MEDLNNLNNLCLLFSAIVLYTLSMINLMRQNTEMQRLINVMVDRSASVSVTGSFDLAGDIRSLTTEIRALRADARLVFGITNDQYGSDKTNGQNDV